MQVAVFSTKSYDQESLAAANQPFGHELTFFEVGLGPKMAKIAAEYEAICAFVNDDLGAQTLQTLAEGKTRLIAMRCAGFNNVDLETLKETGLKLVRVPAYSPHAVAEHVMALLLTLNRKTHRAYNRVREGNFNLEGLMGFDIHGKTVGIIGTGKIGAITAKLFQAFGCHVLAYDVQENPELTSAGIGYVKLNQIFRESDIISLHCPLLPTTHHLIDDISLNQMKDGVCIINTSRGGLIDSQAIYRGLKSGKVGLLGLDVYEEEAGLFFTDHSQGIIQDDLFMRLTTFPNVLITGHQAFFTETAIRNIADTTLANIAEFENGGSCRNEVAIKA
ncbi:MAG: 2-hydroxyacid dehydrogenase [Verrucomicrobiota bacterium JB022]|nr:2-hydroxyacid dehydrogenase [Verrucomicrobiota bacterium JB022]